MKLPEIAQAASLPAFAEYLTQMLVDICRIDTSIRSDVSALRAAESQVFEILEKHLADYDLQSAAATRVPINTRIGDHPFFSQLYYTRSDEHPDGLSVEQTYKDRANLIYTIDGDQRHAAGVNQAANAHIDVVAPFFGPRVENGKVYGRGTCDDKGNVVVLLGAIKLIGDYLRAHGERLNKKFSAMLVIEEEMGGNGSLSAAIDGDLKKRYDSLVVVETCGGNLYPGNRGAVWYKVEAELDGVDLFEAAAFVVEQMEKEGRSIRAESDHSLFPSRPVQTCHGIIGDNGEHPSRINGEVAFDIVFDAAPADAGRTRKLIDDAIDFALNEYIGVYGDKTKAIDETTGKPKVDHHFDLIESDRGGTVTVFGSTGHMGSIFENDGAITKMMTMVRSLMRSREALQRAAGSPVCFALNGWSEPAHLLMEGGQGFVPTHGLDEVQTRMRQAVWRGADEYLRLVGRDTRAADVFQVTFDKLHNAAFAGATDSPEVAHAIEAAKAAGTWKDKPVLGWEVSSDARIFACEYEDMNVLTTGAGLLGCAHSDDEFIDVREMVKTAEFLAYYILKQTGTVQ